MSIIVTGASGYIGRRLVEIARYRGLDVVALGRKQPNGPSVIGLRYDLFGPVPELPSDATAIIHLAARTDGVPLCEVDKEVAAAHRLLTARPAGCHFVFLSSQSADENGSGYGRVKFRIEQMVEDAGGVSIRPGLVYGGPEEGLFGKLCTALRKLPIYPMFILPRPIAQPIHVDDVAEVLLKAAMAPNVSGLLRVCSPAMPFDRFLAAIAEYRIKAKRFPLPVPVSLAVVMLSAAERLTGHTIGAAQLKSLAETKPQESDADVLGVRLRPLADGLRSA